ncbi:ATPase AAA [Sulfodiicoccus acidiphilus]|uniref:ATPase AAA n=1 Tax=Sulfodiicoccus acidiphilus TaxID=1670455 RepID=A0A348B1Y5_9CREN|nr:AAA family ATPase [Sulfodiicoccus acidiphilus]BBD72187.1 ATPase AAA [Sulfodiicoccus acidiphilus]GGT94360.1 ATPase AAA [Sulfodiicoccus acidiphilus]
MSGNFVLARVWSSSKVRSDVVLVSGSLMRSARISPGDVVAIIGVRMVPLTVMENRDEKDGVVINPEQLRWIGVREGERIAIRRVSPEPLKSLTVSPSSQRKVDERKLSLELRGRAVMRGCPLYVKDGELVAVSLTPQVEVGVITGETQLIVSSDVIRLTQKGVPPVTFNDVGGLGKQISTMRKIIELALVRPEVLRLLGLRPPKGVLLYGPPGTGKTLIAKAVANSLMANFYYISGPEIGSKYYGESEKRLREIFEQAEKSAPSVVFIDEIDAIAPNRDVTTTEADRRIVAQLLTLMDGVSSGGGVLVIGATNRPNAVDPALRRPGRFDREIEVPVPDRDARLEILKIHTRRIPLSEDVDVEKIADMTNGFVGADLEALVREATMRALERQPEVEKLRVTSEDFLDAMKGIEPSALREFRVEVPSTRWDDIVGLDEVKQELREVVEWPLKYPETFREAGVEPPTGVLLYGPPGTGKTMLARAVAHEGGANFIAINGPELMNMYVGETEKALREVFKRARQASPTVIFFDEIDAITVTRGYDPNRVSDRLVSQLLTEMDGVSRRRERVVVLAATNRPDIVDPALLRPGRFERLVYVPPPDFNTRVALFKTFLDRHPHGEVDVGKLARQTEFFSVADVKGVVDRAALLAIRRALSSGSRPKVEEGDLVEAMKSIRPTITQAMLNFYNSFRERSRGGVQVI